MIVVHDSRDGLLVDDLGLDHLRVALSEHVLLPQPVLHGRELADTPLGVFLSRRELGEVDGGSAEDGQVDAVALGKVVLQDIDDLFSLIRHEPVVVLSVHVQGEFVAGAL